MEKVEATNEEACQKCDSVGVWRNRCLVHEKVNTRLEAENAELKSTVEELRNQMEIAKCVNHYRCIKIDRAKEIIGLFFKHCPRLDLVTYMGEGNVIRAEQFLEGK